MAFEPNYDKVVSSCRKRLGVTQAQVECKLPANENTQINRVLCTNARSYIGSYELASGEISFSGYVNFQVIYDGGQIQGMDYTAEFKEKFSNPAILVTSVPIMRCSVVDVSSDIISPSELKVSAIIEIVVDVVESNEYNILTSVQGDNIFLKNEDLTYTSYIGMVNNRFDQNFDVEIKDNVSKVLSVSPNIYIEKATPKNDFVEITGGLNIDISYLPTEENATIKSIQKEISFKQEIALKDVREDSLITSVLHMVSGDIKITTNVDESQSIVNIDIPVVYDGYAFNRKSINTTVDLFSTTNDVNVDTHSVAVLQRHITETAKEKFVNNVVIGNDMLLIDDVLAVYANNVALSSVTASGDNLHIEGVATVTVVYFNKEEVSTNSVIVESPFAVDLKIENIEGMDLAINVVLGELYAKGKRGNEIEVSGSLYIWVDAFSEGMEGIISSLKLGEAKDVQSAPLLIYIVKPSEQIWDVAKALSISPEVITTQNPNLELPLQGGERIRVYKQKLVNF